MFLHLWKTGCMTKKSNPAVVRKFRRARAKERRNPSAEAHGQANEWRGTAFHCHLMGEGDSEIAAPCANDSH
jgi:hypothetical protein